MASSLSNKKRGKSIKSLNKTSSKKTKKKIVKKSRSKNSESSKLDKQIRSTRNKINKINMELGIETNPEPIHHKKTEEVEETIKTGQEENSDVVDVEKEVGEIPEPDEVEENKKEKVEVKEHKTKKVVVKKGKSEFSQSRSLDIENKINIYNKKINEIKREIGKAVIGQKKVIKNILICLLCNGNVLLEGVPGIAKTLMIKSLAASIGCSSKRIQFTADLLPSDITGFEAYSREKGFFTVKGPIFANFVLADEINRAPPKVQSALIEVMQEKQVTIGKKTHFLKSPFIVFATENPIENRGVYVLPEAQIDRFLFKIMVKYPKIEDELLIMDTNVSFRKFEEYNIKNVATPKDIINMQETVKKIYVHPKIKKYITHLVKYTRPHKKSGLESNKYIQWGASPRASINLYIAARANAFISGRSFVIPQDVKDVAFNVLRHRVILNYQGQIDNIKTENIISDILRKVKVP